MDKSIIPHVFASLLGLERQVKQITKLTEGRVEGDALRIRNGLRDQQRVIEHMRRAANALQLEIAGSEASKAVRSLRIFYGLNHMVRPELSAALVSLARQKPVDRKAPVATRAGGEPQQLH